MARSRNIKPAFFSNEYLAELSFATRLLFIGLWTEADREGRLEDRPKRLKMSLFPADDVDVEPMIADLKRLEFIRRYEVSGVKVIEIINWKKHQNPHNTEKGSTLPPYENCEEKALNAGLTVKQPLTNESGTVNKLLIPDSLIPDSLIPDLKDLAPQAEPTQKSKRATRLPENWEPTIEFLESAKLINKNLTDSRVYEIAETFRDYWISKSGANATKNDWLAAWRNWIRREASNTQSQRSPPQTQFLTAREKNANRAAQIFDINKARDF